MKALVRSDLHVEFVPFKPPVVGSNLVIMAGDVHKGVKGVR